MKNATKLLLVFGILVSWSCGNSSKEIDKQESQKTEIFTKTYSVKIENNNPEKDTINMIQSKIVDETGKEIANKYYNLDGSVSWKDEYEFDEKGNKIGSKFYEKGKNQTSYYEYDLDSLGRRIAYRAKDINTDTLLYDGASRFEDNGKIRRDGYLNKSGKFRYNFEYQFDDKGKELGYVYIDLRSGDKFPSTYKYTKFNEDGEWIERQIIENEKISSIEIRAFQKIK